MTDRRLRLAQAGVAAAGALVCACAGWLVACTPPSRDLQAGTYRAVVDSPGGDLPFGLQVTQGPQGFVLTLVNGEERLPGTRLQVTKAGQLSVLLPGGASSLAARISGGELRGEIAFAAADGRTHQLPFKAMRGQSWRFFEQPQTDNIDAAGRWDVAFTDGHGKAIRGVAEFRQKFEQVTATIETPQASYRLVGEVHGDELLLSYFDGRVGQLLLARTNKQGSLEGETWLLPTTHLQFVAVRLPATAP
ncbi:MAG TPA: hypothetical protein VF277_09335 [Steroidobacteraceae bacterium]